MSTCISSHGEYSEHTPDTDYVCTLCGVLDEEALIAELGQQRKHVADLESLVAEARDQLDALRAGVAEIRDDLTQATAVYGTARDGYRYVAERLAALLTETAGASGPSRVPDSPDKQEHVVTTEESTETTEAAPADMTRCIQIGDWVIVRTYSAGVHAGILARKEGREVELHWARRIWSWIGAASLSEMAVRGVHPDSRIPAPVASIVLTEAIEILATTAQARASIEAVPEWTRH